MLTKQKHSAGPAANSKSDRTKIGLQLKFLPLMLSAIGK
jgi:hypothetical protein